jgi:preprotein translocase subunit SecG
MTTVLLVVHLIIAAALCGVVLLQRSEGGALGMGGGGGGGGFMTGRGTANLLTRTTAWLGVAFFTTSILLTIMAQQSTKRISPLDRPQPTSSQPAGPSVPTSGAPPAPGTPAAPAAGGVLDDLKKGKLN